MPITRSITRCVLFPLLVLAASGCSSLVDKGNELFEQGMYQEAAEYFQKALLRNPNDVDATMGLNQARNMMIDRGLIEVRMLRLASNQAGATQKLESILRNQKAWNIQMMGAVAMTQEEETRYAEKWLRAEAESLSTSPKPDKFRWFSHSYAYLIANAQMEPEFEKYQPRLNKLGQEQCRAMVGDVSGQRFYLYDFVKKYCVSWGEDVTFKVDSADKSRFQGMDTTHNVRVRTNDNGNQRSILQSRMISLQDQFKNSLWYSPIGIGSFSIKANGDVTYTRKTTRITRTAKYKASEEIKLADGSSQIKELEKVYKYPVNQYNEKYNVNVAYSGKLHNQMLDHTAVGSESNHTEGHNNTFKPAKVWPRTAKFIDIDKELMNSLDYANKQVLDKLNQIWIANYCAQGQGSHHGEYVLRCGKASPDDGYVNSWMLQKFGVDYEAMAQIYGL